MSSNDDRFVVPLYSAVETGAGLVIDQNRPQGGKGASVVAGWPSGAGASGERGLNRRTSRRWKGALPRGLGSVLFAVILARPVRHSAAGLRVSGVPSLDGSDPPPAAFDPRSPRRAARAPTR